MALDRLRYDLLDRTQELGLQQSLQYVERIVLEVNTNNKAVTPTLSLATNDIALSSQSNITRGFLSFDVNRLGPLNTVFLQPFAGIDWYAIEIFMRPVNFRINIVPAGQIATFSGRSPNVATSLIFDVHPFSPPEDPRLINPVIRRLFIDAETGTESFTPVLTFDDGTTQSLSAVTTVGRAITEYSIIGAKRLKTMTLNGDFSSDQIVLYSIDSDLYSPSRRKYTNG